MDRGTCPKDLRYDAKAKIYPNEEFKSRIKAIRKEAEQTFLHKHSNRASLTARPQSSTCTNGFPESVQTIAANLEKTTTRSQCNDGKLEEMNNKTVEAYPCLLSQCVN